jgi:hypothetical protein
VLRTRSRPQSSHASIGPRPFCSRPWGEARPLLGTCAGARETADEAGGHGCLRGVGCALLRKRVGHGLMCAECPHVFREGERFTALLYAFSDDVPSIREAPSHTPTSPRTRRRSQPLKTISGPADNSGQQGTVEDSGCRSPSSGKLAASASLTSGKQESGSPPALLHFLRAASACFGPPALHGFYRTGRATKLQGAAPGKASDVNSGDHDPVREPSRRTASSAGRLDLFYRQTA